jgi:hypothetical protein
MEAMRDATPGMKEYELQADAAFVFKKWGAYGGSYFALIATGIRDSQISTVVSSLAVWVAAKIFCAASLI